MIVSDVPRLKPIDVVFMKELQGKVNLVPVIAKADCLTQAELLHKKETVNGVVLGVCVTISASKMSVLHHKSELISNYYR